MKKTEVNKLIQRIKAYYPDFYLQDGVIDEWYKKLEPYETMDVENKLDNHLTGDNKARPPMLHYITKYLKTPREKATQEMDKYYVRCNLCGEELSISDYNKHYDRCLTITTLVNISKENGRAISYEELDKHDDNVLEGLYKKYIPQTHKITNFFGKEI